MFDGLLELVMSPQAWTALLTLTFMEVILGIDNIIFISIIASKLPQNKQRRASNIGLLLAMVMRVILLFMISFLLEYLHAPWFTVDFLGLKGAPNGQSFILVVGGLFLLYKTIKEMHHKLEGLDHKSSNGGKTTVSQAIFQITLINLVFSVDSILTAIGLTQNLTQEGLNPLPIMILGVIISVLIMIWFAGPIGSYINKHPSVQILALSFLLFAQVGDMKVEAIPKGYLYFAIAFSTIVQLLVIRMQRKSDPVKLHGPINEAKERNILQ